MHKVLYFVAGLAVGFCVDRLLFGEKKEVKKEDDRVMTKPEESEFHKEAVEEAVERAEKIMKEENYIPEEESEEETELQDNIDYDKRYKEFLEKKGDLIELIDYVDAFSGYISDYDVYDDYGSPQDLYWFPESMVLTDGDGGILKPIEKYLGDLKLDLAFEDDEEIFVRNNLIKNRYIVHNQENCTPDEFWG